MTTMNEMYKDGSDHTACLKCGFCHTCKDCKCVVPVLELPQVKRPRLFDNARLKHKIPQHEKLEKCKSCGTKYWTPLSATHCRCKTKPKKNATVKPQKNAGKNIKVIEERTC